MIYHGGTEDTEPRRFLLRRTVAHGDNTLLIEDFSQIIPYRQLRISNLKKFFQQPFWFDCLRRFEYHEGHEEHEGKSQVRLRTVLLRVSFSRIFVYFVTFVVINLSPQKNLD